MAILNYTTTISVDKTAAEIQSKLAKARVQAVLCEYDNSGIVVAVSFRLLTQYGMVSFRLPANVDGVYESLRKSSAQKRLKTREQAARVAWRIVKDWVEAQLAIVEAGMAEITEVFLPYAQHPSGETVYEALRGCGFKALAHDASG